MSDTNRDDALRSTTANPQRSGSDTASAANISAGTSVGNAGQPATPYGQPGGAGASGQGAGGQGSSGQGFGAQGTGSPSSGARGTGGQGTSSANRTQSDSAQQAGRTAGSGGSGARQTAGDLRDQAGDAINQASDWTREQYRQGARQLYQARNQSMQQLRWAQGGIERFVTENPLMVGVMGLAAGLVIGALLPRTRQEDRAFGRWADEVREQGMRYARDATQRGREYVEQALGGSDSEDDWHPEEESRGGVRSAGPRYQNH
jgi:ElaB/YqjD/DUF883 family membrane-anchored ribosome-binding protein